MEVNYFTILYWFCHTSTWIRHRCTRVPHPEPPAHLPPGFNSLSVFSQYSVWNLKPCCPLLMRPQKGSRQAYNFWDLSQWQQAVVYISPLENINIRLSFSPNPVCFAYHPKCKPDFSLILSCPFTSYSLCPSCSLKVKVIVTQSWRPIDCNPTGSSVHGTLQARVLDWVAIPFLQGIFLTQGLNSDLSHCKQILHIWATRDALCSESAANWNSLTSLPLTKIWLAPENSSPHLSKYISYVWSWGSRMEGLISINISRSSLPDHYLPTSHEVFPPFRLLPSRISCFVFLCCCHSQYLYFLPFNELPITFLYSLEPDFLSSYLPQV